jgi:hypothetical protein
MDFNRVLCSFGGFLPGVVAVWRISTECYGSLVDFSRLLLQFGGFQVVVMAFEIQITAMIFG